MNNHAWEGFVKLFKSVGITISVDDYGSSIYWIVVNDLEVQCFGSLEEARNEVVIVAAQFYNMKYGQEKV